MHYALDKYDADNIFYSLSYRSVTNHEKAHKSLMSKRRSEKSEWEKNMLKRAVD